MEEIVFVTHNKGKAKSAEKYFENIKIKIRALMSENMGPVRNGENRKCRFEECLAYHDGKEIHYFYGKHPGNLSTRIQGNDRKEKWSDLWYIFKPNNFEITLAEMNEKEREERRKIDGSVEALSVFAKWYKNQQD